MPADAMPIPPRPTALFIGHPGHELRVYGWSRMVRPKLYALTDGSGLNGASRLDRTASLWSPIGTISENVYGRFSDRDIYQAIMDGAVSQFIEIVDEIAEEWILGGIEVVASDANEGYSSTHDLCCEMAKAAAELVFNRTGRRLERYTFRLTELQFEAGEALRSEVVRLRLDDTTLAEKIAAARSYLELRHEVGQAIAAHGADYFRDEWLLPGGDWNREDVAYKPFYEERGERLMAEGRFSSVLRYREHVLPIFNALREHVAGRSVAISAPSAIA